MWDESYYSDVLAIVLANAALTIALPIACKTLQTLKHIRLFLVPLDTLERDIEEHQNKINKKTEYS